MSKNIHSLQVPGIGGTGRGGRPVAREKWLQEYPGITALEQQRNRKRILKQVTQEFVLPEHAKALEQVTVKEGFAISFRQAGKPTLDALRKGAGAKGHDILEKTIKPASINKVYAQNGPEMLTRVRQAEIEGYVGHWEPNKLRGIYLVPDHDIISDRAVQFTGPSGDSSDIYLINMDDLEESLADLKANENWQTKLFSGDYDPHDLITFRGAGKPRTALMSEEKSAIDSINRAIAQVDPNRPFERVPYNVVRHGPQVNYVSYMYTNEKGAPIVTSVANPGEFPVALVDRGVWSIINNINELNDAYKKLGATMKEGWQPNKPSVGYTSSGIQRPGSSTS